MSILNNSSDSLNYQIIAFKAPHEYITDANENVTSYNFKLEGSYKDLEKILFSIENNYSLGRLVHTNFYLETDYRTTIKKLHVNAIIRHIKEKSD
ncbi:hypothetical protein ACNKXS_13720 [Christiangramia marina]|uniref:hypothetical protein n=1 Tax=Christiangramia marina TaxID=409436 RepID=UPI003AA8D4B4